MHRRLRALVGLAAVEPLCGVCKRGRRLQDLQLDRYRLAQDLSAWEGAETKRLQYIGLRGGRSVPALPFFLLPGWLAPAFDMAATRSHVHRPAQCFTSPRTPDVHTSRLSRLWSDCWDAATQGGGCHALIFDWER
jgi:hypothetical protein